MTRVSASDDWDSIIEEEIDDPEVAQRLNDDLRGTVGFLKQLVSYWKLKDSPEQSHAQTRNELIRIHRALKKANELVTNMGSTARQEVMRSAFRQLPNSWHYSESNMDFEHPADEIEKMLSAYVRIFEESEKSMAVVM